MKKLRSWVTQVTIGSFLLVGVTGLFLFFGVTGGLIVGAHEWISLLFIVAAALHTWLNWSAVCASLSRARGIVIVGFFAMLLIFSIAPGDTVEELLQARGRVDKDVLGKKAGNLLLEAPLSTVSGHGPAPVMQAGPLNGPRDAQAAAARRRARRRSGLPRGTSGAHTSLAVASASPTPRSSRLPASGHLMPPGYAPTIRGGA